MAILLVVLASCETRSPNHLVLSGCVLGDNKCVREFSIEAGIENPDVMDAFISQIFLTPSSTQPSTSSDAERFASLLADALAPELKKHRDELADMIEGVLYRMSPPIDPELVADIRGLLEAIRDRLLGPVADDSELRFLLEQLSIFLEQDVQFKLSVFDVEQNIYTLTVPKHVISLLLKKFSQGEECGPTCSDEQVVDLWFDRLKSIDEGHWLRKALEGARPSPLPGDGKEGGDSGTVQGVWEEAKAGSVDFLTFLVLIVSVILVGLGYIHNERIEAKSATLDLIEKSETGEYYRYNMELFFACAKAGRDVLLGVLSKKADRRIRDRILAYLNHHELIAAGIENNVLNEKFYSDWMRGQYIGTWEDGACLIHQVRYAGKRRATKDLQEDSKNAKPGMYNEKEFALFELLVAKWKRVIKEEKRALAKKRLLKRHIKDIEGSRLCFDRRPLLWMVYNLLPKARVYFYFLGRAWTKKCLKKEHIEKIDSKKWPKADRPAELCEQELDDLYVANCKDIYEIGNKFTMHPDNPHRGSTQISRRQKRRRASRRRL